MRGLGIVGAAAQLRPGSGALRTPARSTFPSYRSVWGRRVQELDPFVDATPRRWGRGSGDWGWQQALQLLLVLDYA